ncbi:MAG: DUF1738 domain-containing protein [Deltaproteobacteria bacterium]|nr:DUF1738 domain-containing protein [Deltaproteobacteria bacterium]
MKSSELKKQYERDINILIENIKNEESSETILDYFNFCSKFHKYSFHNRILIWLSRPDATLVAGFRAWQKLGRIVKKGEKGIPIFAPIRVKQKQEPKPDEKGIVEEMKGDVKQKEDRPVTLFKVVYVWDVSQTEGEPVPETPDALSVIGDAGGILPLLEGYISSRNIRLSYVGDLGRSQGISMGGQIVALKSLTDEEKFHVLTHELAHELLHSKEERIALSKKLKETEAEAVAYIVCNHFNLETKSPTYLAIYKARDVDIRTSFDRIVSTASKVIQGIETREQQRKAA